MEIDENDQHPPSSIIESRKALTMSTNPNQIQTDRFCPNCTSTLHTEQQTDERTTIIDKNLLEKTK